MSQRAIVQWNQWLSKGLGQTVLKSENAMLSSFLSDIYGKHLVLVGVPHQTPLIQNLNLPCHSLLTPVFHHAEAELKVIESNLYELPVASGSVDVAILPHTLEFVDNPRQLLTEACRIIKPEGHLLLCGFNPYSLWGLNKRWRARWTNLPAAPSLHQRVLKKWLHLSDFELVKQSFALYSPPIKNEAILKKLHWMEWLGQRCHLPCGAIYVLMARAKVVPLTPLRMRWKHSIAAMRMPTTIPGPTVRNAK